MKLSLLKNHQGFTLVELLVVLAISGIVLTAIMQVFSNSQATYNSQEDVAAMQQNARTAKRFVERDIRMAGSGAMNLGGPNGKTIQPLGFENGHGPTGTDRLTVIYEMADADSCGPLTAPATLLCSELPPLTLAASMPVTSVEAKLAEELDDAPFNLWDTATCSCNGIVYAPGSKMPIFVTSPDKSRTGILIKTQISNNGGGTLDKLGNAPHVPYAQIPDAAALYNFLGENSANNLDNKPLNEFPIGSKIRFFNTKGLYRATYYVATDANGVMALYRDTGDGGEMIAEHIEDFQCAFELEDGTVVNHRNLTVAEIPDVRLVTLNVVARSGHQYRNSYGTFNGQRMALEDHAAGAPDNYRRRLLSVTVKIRNFGLN